MFPADGGKFPPDGGKVILNRLVQSTKVESMDIYWFLVSGAFTCHSFWILLLNFKKKPSIFFLFLSGNFLFWEARDLVLGGQGFFPGRPGIFFWEARDSFLGSQGFCFWILTTLIARVIKKQTHFRQFDHGELGGIVRFYWNCVQKLLHGLPRSACKKVHHFRT